MKWAWPGIAVVFLAGCKRNDVTSYLAVSREQIQAMQELTDILSTVKDKATMAAALPKLKKSFQRFEQIASKAKALPKPSEEIKQRIEEDLGPQLERSAIRYREEGTRIRQLPGGEDFLKELKKIK
jgi:aspartate-semialdehyde dehydrogenase